MTELMSFYEVDLVGSNITRSSYFDFQSLLFTYVLGLIYDAIAARGRWDNVTKWT